MNDVREAENTRTESENDSQHSADDTKHDDTPSRQQNRSFHAILPEHRSHQKIYQIMMITRRETHTAANPECETTHIKRDIPVLRGQRNHESPKKGSGHSPPLWHLVILGSESNLSIRMAHGNDCDGLTFRITA